MPISTTRTSSGAGAMKPIAPVAAGAALAIASMVTAGSVAAGSPTQRPLAEHVVYDGFDGASYDLDAYQERWTTPYGLGEMAVKDTRTFDGDSFSVEALPFRTGVDLSVFDHIKYLAVSNETFAVPEQGSIRFSVEIDARTVGTDPAGRLISGVYGPSGCAEDPQCAADAEPWQSIALEGQQAGATLHMIDFTTGQLFDWFISGSTAFTLVERLPATVIGSPQGGTIDTMYTQIVDEIPIDPGPHTVAIEFVRGPQGAYVDFFLDDRRVSRVHDVGVALDRNYTGTYPALGEGEELGERIDQVTMGHGLFSLLDAFPFQHPEVPQLSVSVPLSERRFGQGAGATFDDFTITTRARAPEDR